MLYTRFGNTGLVVSRLAFGAMTFGSGNLPTIYKVDDKGADSLVGRALDAGINFFDTADVDLYIVHRIDPMTPMEETLRALDDLVRRGLVRYVGFSNWPAWQAAKAVGLQREHGWARFVGAQMYYSLVGRDIEHEVLPFAADAGVGTMIWGPLAGGFLSGKYTRENLKADDNRLSGFDFLPFDKENGFRLVESMRQVATAHEASVAQVAIAWLLAKKGVSTVILGATKPSQLDDNLGATAVWLSEAELHLLDEVSPHTDYYPSWFTARLRDAAIDKALALTSG